MAEIVVAFTDPISIESTPKNTKWIQYSNENNYDNIDYSNDDVFGIRLEAKFYKPRFPDEDEVEEMSDGSEVMVANSMKTQKCLEIEPLPGYMIKKVKRILKHNTVAIDNKLYVKDAFDQPDLDERFGLFPVTCWLTESEGEFLTNVYGETTATAEVDDEFATAPYDNDMNYISAESHEDSLNYIPAPVHEDSLNYVGASDVQEDSLNYVEGPAHTDSLNYLSDTPEGAAAFSYVTGEADESEDINYITGEGVESALRMCILNPCNIPGDPNSIDWDGGQDDLLWDDGDNVDLQP